jgi:hypothetical protein
MDDARQPTLSAWLSSLPLPASSARSSATTLEDAFADGFALGEVLAMHNQCPSFPSSFSSALARPDAARANWNAVIPELNRLGVRVDARRASALIARAPGAAPALLFELKTHLELLAADGRGAVGRTHANGERPLLSIRERPEKPLYEAAAAREADRLLRVAAGNVNEVLIAPVLRRFTEMAPREYERIVAETAKLAEQERVRLAQITVSHRKNHSPPSPILRFRRLRF